MTFPYLNRVRKPRRLLFSLHVMGVERDLFVQQEWCGENGSLLLVRIHKIKDGHAKFPVPHTYIFDYTGGWHNMANVLREIGLPVRRVVVTEYAFSEWNKANG